MGCETWYINIYLIFQFIWDKVKVFLPLINKEPGHEDTGGRGNTPPFFTLALDWGQYLFDEWSQKGRISKHAYEISVK
jgi:hypothetical protein